MDNKPSILIKCELCGLDMKTRVNGSHLKRIHNISLSDYISKFPTAIIGTRIHTQMSFVCNICGEISKNSNRFSYHLRRNHGISSEVYYSVHILNGILPKCLCGCGNIPEFKNLKVGYHLYLHKHSTPFKTNNSEHKKRKTYVSWNTGLTKHSDDRVLKSGNSIKLSWTPQNLKQRSESYKATMLHKYGVENGFQLDSVKKKSNVTCYKKYGSTNPHFSNLIKYKWKEHVFPSGKIARCQGYEPFAFKYLLNEYSEHELVWDRTELPKVMYVDENGKSRIHCPDIYIPKNNLLIDVKSNFIYNLHKETMRLKKDAAIEVGFAYQILIFNRNGTIHEIL